MKISFDVYNIFYYVSKFQSITHAANYLHVSQPAITRHIKNLELYLGVTLFYRTKNGLKLTPEGLALYEDVKKGIETFNIIENKYNDRKAQDEGTIVVLSGYATTKKILLSKVIEFHKKYPKIKIKIAYYPFKDALHKLQSGSADLLLLNMEDYDYCSDLVVKPFYTLHDILVVSSNLKELYPCEISIKDINNYPIICKENSNSTKLFISKELEKFKIKFQSTWELTEYWLVEEYIKMNMGIGIVSREFVEKELSNKEFYEIKTDVSFPARSIGYAIRKNSILSPALIKFINFLSK